MKRYWLHILLGLLAWGCVRTASNLLAGAAVRDVKQVNEWLGLIMVQPTTFILFALLYSAAFCLLWMIAGFHGRRLAKRSVLAEESRFLHVVLLAYALFVVSLMFLEFPRLTALALSGVALTKAVDWFGRSPAR